MIFSSCYIMVDYDRASMTRMISTSVRIGSLSLVNDDVGEETETYLVISKADHIEDLESSVDETGEVAKINPKNRDKRQWRKCDELENGTNFKGKNKEQDEHEENRWDDTEKNDIIDESWKTLIE